LEDHVPIVTTGLSTSVDGFIAGADDSPEQPLGVGGDRLFKWFGDGDTPSRLHPSFRTSALSAKFFDDFAGRHGAVVTGRRTYDIGGAKDVSIMGASMVQQCLRAGLLDEIVINLVPVVLGRGVRLLDGLEPVSVELKLVRVVDAPCVTHLTYRVLK
jgi:dihydrofolate reductase